MALTRATANIYLIESDTAHPLLQLLELKSVDQMQVEARQSSQEDWQREARKLELQGKHEQVDAIRRTILRKAPVPWPVFEQTKTTDLLQKVFKDKAPGSKPRQQLLDVATGQDLPLLADLLTRNGLPNAAQAFIEHRADLGKKSYAAYASKNLKKFSDSAIAMGSSTACR